jgi:5-methylcytosine-specific restriction enzyme subunit McrC
MRKPLSEILSGGILVDNTNHQVRDGHFTVGHRNGVSIYDGKKEKSLHRGWRFLRSISATLNTRLRSESRAGLVMFSADADYEHNTEDDLLQMQAGESHEDFAFTTGNLIGSATGKTDGYQFSLRISSRFGDEFLKYIIADADGFVELPDQGGKQKGGYEWLLVYLWQIKLKKAFRRGLPKAYETSGKTLTNVRGRLDPVDYALNHERARYRCTYREHSYDNDTTRLIARTLQHLDGHAFLRDAHSLSQTFQIATQGRRHSLQELLAAKTVRNPYYSDYNEVIALSKRILRNDLSDFGDQSQTSAFFFDVSMLFEYFVRKLLKRSGVRLRDKESGGFSIPAGRMGNWQHKLTPDLVFDHNGQTFVFDVKYKSYDFTYGVKREDLFQLHTYVGQLTNEGPIGGCGFIYPIRESRWNDKALEATDGILADTFSLGGRAIPFYVVFLKVPEQGGIASFKLCTAKFVRSLLAQFIGAANLSSITPDWYKAS